MFPGALSKTNLPMTIVVSLIVTAWVSFLSVVIFA
jgi:hypothetical protein